MYTDYIAILNKSKEKKWPNQPLFLNFRQNFTQNSKKSSIHVIYMVISTTFRMGSCAESFTDRIIIFIDNSITYVQRRKINTSVIALYSASTEMVALYTAFFDSKNDELEKINCSKITFGSLTVKNILELPDCSVNNQYWSREVTRLTDHLDLYLEMLETRIKE